MRRVGRLTALSFLALLIGLALPGAAPAQQGARLTVGLSAEPTTLDPHLSGEIPEEAPPSELPVDVVRYSSITHLLLDIVIGVATDRFERAWAWRMSGLQPGLR